MSFEAMLFVKKADSKGWWDGEGKKTFKALPQIGEFIESNTHPPRVMYKIVAIIHPHEPNPHEPKLYPVDIYAVELGESQDVLQRLYDQSKVNADNSGLWAVSDSVQW